MQITSCLQGEEGTLGFRLLLTEGGKVGSFWHDIALDNGDGTVNFVCEIPKDTTAKMEVATVREFPAPGPLSTSFKQDQAARHVALFWSEASRRSL